MGGQRGLGPYQGGSLSHHPHPPLGASPQKRVPASLPACCPAWHPTLVPSHFIGTVAWGLFWGSEGDMFTAGCDSVKWIFFLSAFLVCWGGAGGGWGVLQRGDNISGMGQTVAELHSPGGPDPRLGVGRRACPRPDLCPAAWRRRSQFPPFPASRRDGNNESKRVGGAAA